VKIFEMKPTWSNCFVDEMSFRVVDRVLQIHGGIGLTLDLPLAKWFVDQRSRLITEGASEVNAHGLAATFLKKYVEQGSKLFPTRFPAPIFTCLFFISRERWLKPKHGAEENFRTLKHRAAENLRV